MQTIKDAERIGEIKVVDYTSEVVAMTKKLGGLAETAT
jgi:hypothetical protein